MQTLCPGWQDLTDLQWQEACRREAVIRPLAELEESVSREVARGAAERLGISPRMVYRLVARFRRRPQGEFAGARGAGPRDP
jgi:Helix-turn-helix domain